MSSGSALTSKQQRKLERKLRKLEEAAAAKQREAAVTLPVALKSEAPVADLPAAGGDSAPVSPTIAPETPSETARAEPPAPATLETVMTALYVMASEQVQVMNHVRDLLAAHIAPEVQKACARKRPPITPSLTPKRRKTAVNAYMHFCKVQRKEHGTVSAKQLAAAWGALSTEQKEHYKGLAVVAAAEASAALASSS